jgi:hypothetical protein
VEAALLVSDTAPAACSQAKVCGDEGVSVRVLLVVLALEVRTCPWPWPGMRARLFDDDVVPADVELERVGRFDRAEDG